MSGHRTSQPRHLPADLKSHTEAPNNSPRLQAGRHRRLRRRRGALRVPLNSASPSVHALDKPR